MVISKLRVLISVDDDQVKSGVRDTERAMRGLSNSSARAGQQAGDRLADGLEDGLRDGARGMGAAGQRAGRSAGEGVARGVRQSQGMVKKSMGRLSGVMRSQVGQIGSMFAGAFAVGKMAEIGKESIGMAASMTEATGKVDVVFGSAAESVKAFANDGALAFRMNKLEATQALGVYGNLLRALEVNEAQAGDMSVGLVKLAGDMASFNDATAEETLNALRAGLVGETEPLKRFGVSLSAAAIDAYALSNGMVKTEQDITAVKKAQMALADAQAKATKVNKDAKATDKDREKAALAIEVAEKKLTKTMEGKKVQLTASQKATAAYGLIMEQTKLQQGDAARTADTATARQAELTNSISNLKLELGGELLPVYDRFLKLMMDKVIPALKDAMAWFKDNQETIKSVAKTIGKFAMVLGPVIAAIKIATMVTAAFNAIMLLNPAVAIAAAIAGLVIGLTIFFTKTEMGREIVRSLGEAMSSAWESVKTAFGNMLDRIESFIGAIRAIPSRIRAAARGMFDGIKDSFKAALDWIKGLWGKLSLDFPGVNAFGKKVGGFSLKMPKIPMLAAGGLVTRPTLAMVGEAGPEAVIPLTRAGQRLAGISGGGGSTYNLTVQVNGTPGMDAATVRREARKAGEALLKELRTATRTR
jgi:hypothetical protein